MKKIVGIRFKPSGKVYDFDSGAFVLKRGDQVMIMEGPLKGLVGFYVQHKGRTDKVVVNVDLLHRSLVVEIEDWALEKIS